MTGTASRTPKFALAAIACLAAALSTGCAWRDNTVAYGNKPPEPGIDSAIVLRHYDSSVASYANTVVIAGSTRFPLTPDVSTADWVTPLSDPFIFVGNLAVFPVSILVAPPYTQKTWRSTALAPTYSANPSLDDVYELGHGGGGAPVTPSVRPR